MKTTCLIVTALVLASCVHLRKINTLRRESVAAQADLPAESLVPKFDDDNHIATDTLSIRDAGGRQILLMHAVADENGELVAHERLSAAVVTARFRNVAERQGKVALTFDITVPSAMTDSEWMLRVIPRLQIADSVMDMEALQVTGLKYRKAQLAGYAKYRRFLESIVADSAKFVDERQLKIFIQRNIENLENSEVTKEEAIEHYTRDYIVRYNRKKVKMKDKMREKYIKMPVIDEGLRLDTIITGDNDDIIYRYTQNLTVKGEMRKATIVLSGEIYREDRLIYKMPEAKPLDFYISSLSTLCDESVHYISTIVYRNAQANSVCYIDFAPGSSQVDLTREGNTREMGRIKGNFRELLTDANYEMDSITVSASCSPEGSYTFNGKLAGARAKSVTGYFEKYVRRLADSLETDKKEFKFKTSSIPENWEMLDALVENDSILSPLDRAVYRAAARISDPDERERQLSRNKFYMDLRSRLYPKLRIVAFGFYLHRKGMIKDTVHTTIPDTIYAKGVAALKARDYKEAIRLLRSYKDYNTAVAYCSAGYNASALEILETLPKNDRVCYMLALIYSRKGQRQKAVENFIEACRKNSAMINRGNLDPEISTLIREYNLQNILYDTI